MGSHFLDRRALRAAFVLLSTCAGVLAAGSASAQRSFTVTTAGFAYTVSGLSGNNPALTVERGRTHTFVMQVGQSHPFYIKTTDQSSGAADGFSGASNNGAWTGTITLTVPAGLPGPLWYQCGNHSGMLGRIDLIDPPPELRTAGATCSASTQCQSGACRGDVCCQSSAPCPGPASGQQCRDSTPICIAGTGACGLRTLTSGACNDGNLCTDNDRCGSSGNCGGTARTCNQPVPGQCVDTSTGGCNPSNGQCEYTGTAPDGEACTVTNPEPSTAYSCQGGQCIGQRSSGTGFLWGSGSDGQLGNGQSGSSTATPIGITAGGQNLFITQMAHGTSHTVALTSDGSVWTWGNNDFGQIGDGTRTDRSAPVRVFTETTVAIAAGPNASYAVWVDGTLYAWGKNQFGELGDPAFTATYSASPRPVPGDYNFTAVAPGGQHVLGLLADGTLIAWGSNNYGQIGSNHAVSSTPVRTPRVVAQPTGATLNVRYRAVAAGLLHSLALGSDGVVYGWGSGAYGAIGPPTSAVLRPLRVQDAPLARAIAAGGSHSLAIDYTGAVYAWGNNTDAQLGLGNYDYVSHPTPTRVPRLSNAIAVAASNYNSAAVLADGSLWTWGSNQYGQLGDASRRSPDGSLADGVPQPVAGLNDVEGVALGAWHASAVRPLDSLQTWGWNMSGMLGNGENHHQQSEAALPSALKLPPAIRTVKAISTGLCNSHNLLLAGDGRVWSWGANVYGELGVPGGAATEPVLVRGLPPIMAIAAGCYVSAALAADGTVWTWGFGGYGTLGHGNDQNLSAPAKVGYATTGVMAIALRGLTLATLRVTGTVIAWGFNANGQLGDGAVAPRNAPGAYLPMPGFRNVRALTMGFYSGYGVLDNGTVAAWGSNSMGLLGINSANTGSFTPTLVAGVGGQGQLAQVAQVVAGPFNAAAQSLSVAFGAFAGWGSMSSGQLGGLSSTPMIAPFPFLGGARKVSFGMGNSAAVLASGRVVTAGDGQHGALGTGTAGVQPYWGPVPSLANATAVDTGQYFAAAIVPGPERAPEYAVVECGPKVALVAPATPGPGNTCSVHAPAAGTAAGVVLRGDVLAPDRVYRRGEVLVGSDGTIACVGCDCSTAAGYAQATRIDCPNGAISPGLINTHEHLSCRSTAAVRPEHHDVAPYSFRDDWTTRTGGDTDGFADLGYSCSSPTGAELAAAEMRHLVSGTTSVLGNGTSTSAGFLRNLDVVDIAAMLRTGRDRREGVRARVITDTFPLNDRFMTAPADGSCMGAASARVHGADAEVFHLGEGIDARAERELTCGVGGALNVVRYDQTSLVHAIAIAPQQAEVLRGNAAWVSWSPRSNIDLYGATAPVVMLDRMGVGIALGTDWSITGSVNLTRELACAADYNGTYLGNYFSDYRLWQMVTGNAAFAAGVERKLGSIKPGAIADLAVFDQAPAPLHSAIVRGGPRSVALVLRGGQALYGDSGLFTATASPWRGAAGCRALAVCGVSNKYVCGTNVTAFNPYLAYCGTESEPSCTPRRAEYGAVSEIDRDGDGFTNDEDNCPSVFNPPLPIDGGLQADSEPNGADGIGDACDPCPVSPGASCSPPSATDFDADGIANTADSCAWYPSDGTDSDGDGIGDVCDCSHTYCYLDVAVARDDQAMGYLADGDLVLLADLYVTAIRPGQGFFAQADPRRIPSGSPHANYGYMGIYVATTGTPMAYDFVTGVEAPIAVGDVVAPYGALAGSGGLRTVQAHAAIFQSRGGALPFAAQVRNARDLTTYSVTGSNTTGLLAEQYESMWMRVTNTRLTDPYPDGPTSTSNEFEVLFVNYDPAAWSSLRIDDHLTDYSAQLPSYRTAGRVFSSISGVLIYTDGDHKLAPRSTSEVVLQSTP